MSPVPFPLSPVLLVDDEEETLFAASLMLRSSGIKDVIMIKDSREVVDLLKKQTFSCAVIDLTMPYVSGSQLLSGMNRDYPDIPVIIMTGLNEVDTAVDCMRHGAFDYLVKPVEKVRFMASVHKALELSALKSEVTALKRHLLEGRLDHELVFASIVTRSRAMHAIFQYIEVVAPSSQPVLISGETGVGKELVARAVHDLSSRNGQFIGLNVAGIDETVFSDVLFGHRKGAYTGADSARDGLIARAAGGTLFLDEIGDLKESLQIKLLRLLQEHTYFPLGSDVSVQSDARIVVATNRNLDDMVSKELFRKDLYYRLRSHHVALPPLRERTEDIPLLLYHFVKECSASLGKKEPVIPDELIPLLSSYHFPGNIRELQSMVHDALSQHDHGQLSLASFREIIRQENLSSPQRSDGAGDWGTFPYEVQGRLPTLQEADEYLLSEAMKRADGNQGIAASMLGLTRQALNKRLIRKKQ
ncbi:MAG: sigma-54-dependent Fis family transcriptional regulator [Nitrospirae bacterium]|nr:sigma-54-dependent Fis family transcriptional regulator [Nitrospirota bacterium]